MNFKFTKAKTIVAIVIGIFDALFFSPILSASIWFSLLMWGIGFLIGFGLVYAVWSLIQKVPAE